MKKLLTLLLTLVLTVGACMGLTACGKENTPAIKEGSKIVIGITDYEPMDYKETPDGEWIGFEAELSKKVFTDLGYTVEFKEIDWDTKIVTLKAGTIDCIWNGMTVNDELLENLILTNVYLKNQQVVVAKSDAIGSYKNLDSLAGKTIAVESGSAAEALVPSSAKETRKVTNQITAITEVVAGTADIAIVDLTMAKTLTGEGGTYNGQLSFADVGFATEEFAAAFRKADSKLCWEVNKKLSELYADNTVQTLAEKYGIANLLVK